MRALVSRLSFAVNLCGSTTKVIKKNIFVVKHSRSVHTTFLPVVAFSVFDESPVFPTPGVKLHQKKRHYRHIRIIE